MTGCGGGGTEEEVALADAGGEVASSAGLNAPMAAKVRKRATPSSTTTPTAPTEPTSATPTTPTTPTEPTGTATPSAAAAYPFGARLVPYAAGIRPTQSSATMDALLKKQYDAWKAHAVVSASSIVAGGYAVKFSNTTYLAVSEGMGFGMLLAVLFAGHDPQARSLFDGLLAVVRARPAYGVTPHDPNGKYLMDWRLYANGTSAGEGWNAMDGDEDIAMALLMADKQWGSGGTWNYLLEARNTIAALKSWNMKPDGTTKGLKTPDVSRTSDYMIGHFRAFKLATGDAFWDTAITRAYDLANRMQTVYSPGVGLLPDFVVDTNTTTPRPSPGMMGDFNYNEDKYWWNACRNPWRYSSDYLLSGDTRWKTVTARMIDFFRAEVAKAGGNVTAIGTGYTLAGLQVTGGESPAYHGPICAGACIDASYQSFLDSLWNWNAANLTTGYYDGEIQLLSLVVASGNWWTPGAPSSQPPATTSTTPPPSTTAAAGNLLTNGDFAGGLTGWSNWGNSQVVGGVLQVGTAAGGLGQNIDTKVAGGVRYRLTGTANITAAAEGVFVGVKLMDSAGTVLLDQLQVVSSLTPAAVAITFTAPAGVASGYVYVWKNANAALGVVDNLSLAVTA
jgi:Glycosyl hydrolases family 8